MLHAWFPGQYGGQPLAEILFGEVNPSGKLPITIEKRVQDNPAFATFPINDAGCPENRIFGRSFRGLSRLREEPHQASVSLRLRTLVHEIPLLGYRCRPLASWKNILRRDDDLVRVSFRVKNTGKRAGAEIAQLYVAPVNPPVERPLKELKGFQKVYLKPGESKKVTITLDRRSLAYYNVATQTWDVAPGALQDSGRLFLAGHRIAKAAGELVPVVAFGLGEFAGARSENGRPRLLIERARTALDGKAAAGTERLL